MEQKKFHEAVETLDNSREQIKNTILVDLIGTTRKLDYMVMKDSDGKIRYYKEIPSPLNELDNFSKTVTFPKLKERTD